MKLVAWNTPRCSAYGEDACPSALWFWVALAVVGLLGFGRRKG